MNKIFCGDAPEVLRQLPSESVQMCVTSPPYYGLRDYGVDGQFGCEPSPLAYAERLVEVFREVRRVLRQDGTLWLNIGDCYAGSGKGIWSKPVSERPKSKQLYCCKDEDATAAVPKTSAASSKRT